MEFKQQLTLTESILMAQEVSDTVFDTNVETGVTRYSPYLYDFALRISIAKYYGGYSLTGDNDTDYEVAMNISITDLIDCEQINKEQYLGVETAINEMISFRKEELHKTNINIVSQFDELIPVITDVINTVNKKLSVVDMKKLNNQIKSLNMKKLIDEYTKSDRYNGNTASILDTKNRKINELQAELNKYTSKNVKSMTIKE